MARGTPAERRRLAQALPPLRDADAAAIEAFLDATWAESGLARQSLASYRRDLEGYARWRDGAGGGLAGADRAALFDYLAYRTGAGYSPRSNARLLSSLRAFYAHAVRRGQRSDDPCAQLEPPRLPRLLPKALAESQVDALLAAPDVATPQGLRDRAMLELMYACGLRVSELVGHAKERAEHVMLIDLERNDLGRLCVPGSVVVDEIMQVESYAHVHHIVSNVRGRLREGTTPGAAIRAVFPGGTITGCPKVRCMQIIAALEGVGRGAYTGSFGYLNRDGDLDLNILIRTLSQAGGRLRFRAGAGIVADSVALSELDETRAKARGLLRALGAGS